MAAMPDPVIALTAEHQARQQWASFIGGTLLGAVVVLVISAIGQSKVGG
jgi:hypothetical protein